MNSIDASIIGLQATLQLLQQYYQSGILQADISSTSHTSGLRVAYITINEGNIVSCYIQDEFEHRLPTEIAKLLALDAKAGPLAWRFLPPQQGPRPETRALPAVRPQPASQQLTSYAVPRRIANLDLSWITTWLPQQKRILRMVYSMVDGQRSVAIIERSVPIPNAIVQEALVILIAMQVITVTSQ